MTIISRRTVILSIAATAVLARTRMSLGVEPYGPEDAKITIIVMDPMSLPLACDCVQGYAQRKYERLADYLKESVGESVRVVWGESLERAIKDQAKGRVTLVIGKDSVVRYGASKAKLNLKPIAHLTDMTGSIKQHGLFVVRQNDKAATLLDIEGYKVFWGPEDCDEKAAAPKAKLKELEIETTDGGACDSCSVAAKQLLEQPADAKAAAVISSYAEPLLAGCGSIKKGDLKIVGKSEEVAFVSAFIHSAVPEPKREAITKALLAMSKSEDMLTALETKDGFVKYSIQ